MLKFLRETMGSSALAYLVFFSFCIISGIRDVITEYLFKDEVWNSNPVFTLFVFSISAIVFVVLFLFINERRLGFDRFKVEKNTVVVFVKLNFFTFLAFGCFLLAIDSSFGAALNSVVDYGTSPIFTGILAAIVLGEKLGKVFWVSLFFGVSGILLIANSRVSFDVEMHASWYVGLLCALSSSLSSAFCRAYYKKLVDLGVEKLLILFWRMTGMVLVLFIFMLVYGDEYWRSDLLVITFIVGLFGFVLPIYLMLLVVQNFELKHVAVLLMLYPVFTLLFASAFGYYSPAALDMLGILLVLGAVLLHETIDRV
ncbi:DMT family transporter [Endothiovibrio diazotrophicus]